MMSEQTNKDAALLIGFDFGMKRIGIAVGQTITKTARALQTISANKGCPNWDEISNLLKKWSPDALVVGVPLNMDGTQQPLTHHAKQFAYLLKKRYQLTVYEIDERLTSKDARERLFLKGGYKALQDGQVDRIAAQLILQNWFAEYV